MNEKTFAQYEQEGWQHNATYYDEIDLPATRQSFTPLVESIGDLQGLHVLDIGSGTGHLAEQAVVHGATVTGIDVASNMVELSRQNVPNATFHEGDAEALLEFGIELAVRQCAELLEAGVPGLHIYTMDRSKSTVGVVNHLRDQGLL